MEHGLFTVGWVWWKKAELTYNVNHGWACIISPVAFQRKVVKNTNQENKLYVGAIVKLPLDLLNKTGTIKSLTYGGNYCIVESRNEKFVVSKDDIYSAF